MPLALNETRKHYRILYKPPDFRYHLKQDDRASDARELSGLGYPIQRQVGILMNPPDSLEEPTRWTVADRLRDFSLLGAAMTAKPCLSSRLLDDVEDQYSGVRKRLSPGLVFDGRMYPPYEDFIDRFPDGAVVART